MESLSTDKFRINSVDEFVSFLKLHPIEEDKFRLFRGQKYASWRLESRLYREVMKADLEQSFYEIEKRLFDNFRKKLEILKKEISSNT